MMSWLTFIAPLVSVFLLVLGNGVSTTITTLEMNAHDSTDLAIGAVASAYFMGLIIGSYGCQKIIIRVGHIRAFSAFVALLIAVVLIQGGWYNIWLWMFCRLMVGYCLAGAYIVIESWLLGGATSATYGRVLGIYMMTFYLAQAASQFFLNIDPPYVLIIFCIIAFFSALSVVPLCMTRYKPPAPEQPEVISLRFLFQRSAVGVLGCFCAGIVLSVIYTFLPKFAIQSNHEDAVAMMMFLTILGGTLLQLPFGKLSDIIDRRRVLLIVCIGVVLASIAMIFMYESLVWVLVASFILGGSAFAIYPISISYAVDFIESNRVISATALLFVSYGIGSTIGPLLVVLFTYFNDVLGYFYYLAVVSALFGLYIIYRMIRLPVVFQTEDYTFVSVPQTSFEAQYLDPRTTDGSQLELNLE